MNKNLNENKVALSMVTYFALFITILGCVFLLYSSILLAIEESNGDSYYYTPDETLSAMKTYSIPLILAGLITVGSFSSLLKMLDTNNTASNMKKSQKRQKDLGDEIEYMSMSEIDALVQNALNSKNEMIQEIEKDEDSPFPHVK